MIKHCTNSGYFTATQDTHNKMRQ